MKNALHFVPSLSSSLAFALLPKCPMCLALLLAPLGITLSRSSPILTLAGLLLLLVPIALLAVPAYRKSSVRLALVPVIGVLLMAIGRFAFDNSLVIAMGAILIIGTVIVALTKRSPACAQGHCSQEFSKTQQEKAQIKWLTS
jgi:hypothetical protein